MRFLGFGYIVWDDAAIAVSTDDIAYAPIETTTIGAIYKAHGGYVVVSSQNNCSCDNYSIPSGMVKKVVIWRKKK